MIWYDENLNRKGTIAFNIEQTEINFTWFTSDSYLAAGKVYFFGWTTKYAGTPLSDYISVLGFIDTSSGDMSSSGTCFDNTYQADADTVFTNSVGSLASATSASVKPLSFVISTFVSTVSLTFNTDDSFTDSASEPACMAS